MMTGLFGGGGGAEFSGNKWVGFLDDSGKKMKEIFRKNVGVGALPALALTPNHRRI